MEIEEKIHKIYTSDEDVFLNFILRPYALEGKEFLFIQLKDSSQEADIDKLVNSLDTVFREIESNGIFNIILSFKGITFMDVSISIIFSHAQRIEMNGGELIFIDVLPKIIDVWHRLELDKFVSIYRTESEVVKK